MYILICSLVNKTVFCYLLKYRVKIFIQNQYTIFCKYFYLNAYLNAVTYMYQLDPPHITVTSDDPGISKSFKSESVSLVVSV